MKFVCHECGEKVEKCFQCGKKIRGDWRFGKKKVGGVYLCSKECEREWQAIMEEYFKGGKKNENQKNP